MAIINGVAKSADAGGGFYPKTIEQSLRFNDNDSAYLSRTPASAGNRKTWTWSGWVKSCKTAAFQHFFDASPTSGAEIAIRFRSTDTLQVFYYSSGYIWNVSTKRLFRDPSAWYHITVAFDTTQATASDRIKLYVNGELQTDLLDTSYPALNGEYAINNNIQHFIGRVGFTDDNKVDGYLAEVHFTDGTAYDATAFGEFKNGVWVAKEFTGSYGTNGFYLDFADGGALGNDVSGNNNDWTATNLASTDVMLDSPTNNFATLNPLAVLASNGSLQEGNLEFTTVSSGSGGRFSTFAIPSSGKYYAEMVWLSYSGTPSFTSLFGLCEYKSTANYINNDITNNVLYESESGELWVDGVETSTSGDSWTTGDVIGVTVDADSDEVKFYKNGTLQYTQSHSCSGLYIAAGDRTSSSTSTLVLNFGQDSSFAGNKTPQGNTDANGIGDFYYAPPTGALALCTANLPDLTASIDPAQGGSPQDHFNTILWTGDGSSVGNTQAISGVGFQPDLVWTKARSTTYGGPALIDAIRGDDKILISYATDAEYTSSDPYDLVSFDSDGFTVGYGGYLLLNHSGVTNVAWNWKANGSGVTNTDGSITSTVSANVDAGFSIATFTPSGAFTVGHGLSSPPELIITKATAAAGSWFVQSAELGNTKYLTLETTNAARTNTTLWQSTSPTSTVWSGNGFGSYEYVAYAFHSVDGFSKFGSYTGNGSTDGTFVALDFEPAFVMIKRTDGTASWSIRDSSRNEYNAASLELRPDSSTAEYTDAGGGVDLLSNGFKLRSTTGGNNASGGTYIFAAFAKTPAKYSNAR